MDAKAVGCSWHLQWGLGVRTLLRDLVGDVRVCSI